MSGALAMTERCDPHTPTMMTRFSVGMTLRKVGILAKPSTADVTRNRMFRIKMRLPRTTGMAFRSATGTRTVTRCAAMPKPRCGRCGLRSRRWRPCPTRRMPRLPSKSRWRRHSKRRHIAMNWHPENPVSSRAVDCCLDPKPSGRDLSPKPKLIAPELMTWRVEWRAVRSSRAFYPPMS